MRILYIDIDSLRPDHLGCYGYGRDTSPNIDRIASEGVRFTNCYASDMPCMPSRTSLFSGRLGIHHGCVAHTGTRAEPFSEGAQRHFRSEWSRTNWMRQLRNAGLRTATFSCFGERHSAWHWYAGFEEIHDTGGFGHKIAEEFTHRVHDWLERNGSDDNWFLHVNFWDVHTPPRTPEAFGVPFADQPLPDPWLTQEALDRDRRQPGNRSPKNNFIIQHAAKYPKLNPSAMATLQDVKLMLDGYDGAILYTDQQIGLLLDILERHRVLDDTAIIISADHGECLGELNAYGGHCFADHCTGRIPLIVRWPRATDATAGCAADGLIYNIDLAATVTDLVGQKLPAAWDARSMTGALRGEPVGRDYLVVSQLAQSQQRAVRFRDGDADYLYIRTYSAGDYRMPGELLFDVGADPHEQTNLTEGFPNVLAQARTLLEEWVSDALKDSSNGDPLDTVLKESAGF